MTVHLGELFDPLDLEDACDAGFVRWQRHPELPLLIYNYTARAAHEQAWTPVTRQCRGLIATEQGEVVARPWAKFYNHGDPEAPTLDLDAHVEVTDKLDGSLGILYPTPDGWAVATRGSFTSEQAIHATELLRTRYPRFEPPPGYTVLFEIVYPGNRIVVDYGDTDDLTLLGAIRIEDGAVASPGELELSWRGPTTRTFTARTLADALALEPRPNAEGVVVRDLATNHMVKLKQADYIELHKLIMGLNERVVWERLGAGETAADICAAIPDEFHKWVNAVAQGLNERAEVLHFGATDVHKTILRTLPEGWTRRDYAERAKESCKFTPWLFLLLDGKDPRPKIWQSLKPSGQERPISISEDVA